MKVAVLNFEGMYVVREMVNGYCTLGLPFANVQVIDMWYACGIHATTVTWCEHV